MTAAASDSSVGAIKVSMAHVGNAVASCLGYSFCSISMMLVNKVLLSKYNFEYHMALLLFQTVCSYALLRGAHTLGVLTLQPVSLRIALRWAPVNVFFLSMLFSSYLSLQLLTVPMVTVFKNVTNAVTLAGEWYLFKQTASRGVIASLGLIILGAILSAINDVSYSGPGYFWMFINCCSTASYLLYMRKSMQTLKLAKFDLAHYNALVGLPLITVACFFTGDLPGVLSAPQLADAGFIVAAMFSGVVGFAMSLVALWCIGATSASTYSMVGAINKVPLSIISFFVFHQVLTVQLAVSLGIGVSAGVMFSYTKSREVVAARARKRDVENPKEGGDEAPV